MQESPDIKQTLSSLKQAMTSEDDQILEELDEHGDVWKGGVNESLKDVYSVEESSNAESDIEAEIDDEDAEAVFSSEDDVEEPVINCSNKEVFILNRMIKEDGTVVNLNKKRPNINISNEKIETIVREEAKNLLKDWIDKNMYSILKKYKEPKK
ncbi:MAG: DUF2497 domain-containing protein [Alphaproteobacteria bacterium]|jgi:hypothetical protein|nr:DUF2497 domain-containing protein [Alphaproteobacteria bacterium]